MECFFESAAGWRDWLEKHHASERVAWLIFYKAHTGRVSLRYEKALDEALCYGWIDSIIKRIDDERYCQKFTPRTNTLRWSDANVVRMRRLIAEGRMTDIGLSKVGDPSILEQDPPPRADVPADDPPDFIREAFEAEPAAGTAFGALTPGRRRLYLRWVLDARRDETRRKRLQELIGLLKEGKPLSMK